MRSSLRQRQHAPDRAMRKQARPERRSPEATQHSHPLLQLQRTLGNQAVLRLLQRDQAADKERGKWQQQLKGKSLPRAGRIVDGDTAFYVEGLIETSTFLKPYVEGKIAKTSVAKNFHTYGSDEEFQYQADKLVGKSSDPGTKVGGFYDRKSDSIHMPPRAAFGHALHEGIHKYSSIALRNAFGQFLNEGVTQYFTDRLQTEQGVEGQAKNEYGQQLACAKIVLGWLSNDEKILAEAYFQGKVGPLREAIHTKLGINDKQRTELVAKDALGAQILKKGP